MARSSDPLETMPVSPYARPTRWVLALWAAAIMIFLYLPIAFLVLFSFNAPRTPGLPITELTLHWYEVAAGNSILLEAVKNSIVVAAAVAVIATLIGTMAAFPLVLGVLIAVQRWRSDAALPLLVLWSPVIAMVPATPLVAMIIHVSQVSGLRSREKLARGSAARKA